MEHWQRQRRRVSVIATAMVIATGAVAAMSAHAYAIEPPSESALCWAEASSALAGVENFLGPANGSMVAAGTPITFSSNSSEPLSFAIASSEALLSTPNVDSGPGSPSPPPPNASGTQHYSFTSTKATATAGTVYWQASFSTAAMPHCADHVGTEKTAVRTLTVLSPPSSEEEAGAKKKGEEEAAAKTGVLGVKETSPNATLASTSLTAGSQGVLSVTVSCPAEVSSCTGTITLKTLTAASAASAHQSKKSKAMILTLAVGSFKVVGGYTTTVKLHLSAKARTLLARTRVLHVRATIVAHDPAGATHTTQTILTIRAARAIAGHKG